MRGTCVCRRQNLEISERATGQAIHIFRLCATLYAQIPLVGCTAWRQLRAPHIHTHAHILCAINLFRLSKWNVVERYGPPAALQHRKWTNQSVSDITFFPHSLGMNFIRFKLCESKINFAPRNSLLFNDFSGFDVSVPIQSIQSMQFRESRPIPPPPP